MPKLHIVAGEQVREVTFSDELTIGRAETNALVLDGNRVSQLHATISPAGAGWLLTDCNSSNGVLVNDVRIFVPQLLARGDEITIGKFVLVFNAPAGFEFGATNSRQDAPPDPASSQADIGSVAAGTTSAPGTVESPHIPQLEFSAAEVRALANPTDLEERRMLLEHAERLRTLVADLRKNSMSLHGRDIPSEFLKTILEVVGGERGVIGERVGDNRLRGGAIIPKSSRFAITRIVLQSVLRDRKYVFCNNAFGDPRFTTSRSIVREKTGSLMAVPLTMEGHPVGYMYVDALDQTDVFRPSHLCLLAYAGEQLALVLAEQQLAEQFSHSEAATQPLDAKAEQQLLHETKSQTGFFRGSNREKRIQAFAQLGTRRSVAGLAEILASLQDKDAAVAAACASALADFGALSFPNENAVQYCDTIFAQLVTEDSTRRQILTDALQRAADKNSLVRMELMKRLSDAQLSQPLRAALATVQEYFERKAAISPGESEHSLDVSSRPKTSLVEFERQQSYQQARQQWIKSGRVGPEPKPPA